MNPRRFRKKPVEIEARRIAGYTELLPPGPGVPDGGELWRWLAEHGQDLHVAQDEPGPAYGLIPTLEGVMRADVGDWIIRGVAGEFYPCKPDIFDATYDPADERP